MPRVKKQIEDFDFILLYHGNVLEVLSKQLERVQDKLAEAQITVLPFYLKKENQTYLLVAFKSQKALHQQASQLKLLKRKDKRSFRLTEQQITKELKEECVNEDYRKYLYFLKARLHCPQLLEQEHLSPYNPAKSLQFRSKLEPGQSLFTPDEQMRCRYNELLSFQVESTANVNTVNVKVAEYPFQELMALQHFDSLIPIHKPHQYVVEGWDWYYKPVKEYLGNNVEVYFDFIRFLQRWLVPPTIFGLLTILCNSLYGYTADNSPMDSIYALFVVLWGVFFVSQWEGHEKWLKVKEANGYDESWALHQRMVSRARFQTRISPVTGTPQQYHNLGLKIFLWGKTCFILSLIMVPAVLFMVLSLNARGFIDPSHKLLYWPSISAWAERDGIFDANSWYSLVPMILHVVITNGIDEHLYRPVAIYTTRLEHHLEPKHYQNSIIVKFFIYEFLITFADMFYIAFIRFDIMGLKEQLVWLFFIDIVRRFAAETLLPNLIKTYRNRFIRQEVQQGRIAQEDIVKWQAQLEANRPVYEPFDDYLEIVTNYAYLVMLSSCFPVAPLLILGAHLLEVMHDKSKLLFIYRRALPRKFEGIGFWKHILVVLTFCSIFTNILLFAFSSQQIVKFFPRLFNASSKVITGESDLSTFVSETVLDIQNILTPEEQTRSTSTVSMWCPSDPVSIFSQPTFFEIDLKTRAPPTEQNRAAFVVVIFVIEHICVMATLLIRRLLHNRKNLADIFKERRSYKRSIKARIPKDSLNRIIEKTMPYSRGSEQSF